MVIAHDDIPRTNWKLAVVEKLITVLDGISRAAEIRTAGGKTNHPITRLFPMDVNEDGSSMEIQQVPPSDVSGDTQNTVKQDRLTRGYCYHTQEIERVGKHNL